MSRTEHDVRFTGGPFYWRKGRRGTTIRMLDSTQSLKVIGKVRGIRQSFQSAKEVIEYVETHRGEYSTGTYERVAPDRMVWKGWDS